MNNNQSASALLHAAVIAGAALCGQAAATEGGGSIYPNGVENFLVGAMPPPGFYPLVYATSYHATELRDDRGNDIAAAIGGFKADVAGVIPRFIWVTGQKVLGGQLAVHAIVPLLNVDVRVGANRSRNTGIGDINLAAALGYHVSPELHYVVALETNAPTGRYDRSDVANIGRNYWNIEPLIAVSYIQPKGLNADIKLMYDYNFRNNDTDYKSGQELHADYALGWGLGKGFVAGVSGYIYRQITDDKVAGHAVAGGNRGRAFAIGPSLRYQNDKGWMFTAKYEKQYDVRNRSSGGAFWIKTLIAL
ncbi:SphA family protein [Janthinobacterium sp. HLX7-2]|uniref:SphA family protein n=1 Tax=Janthinobacterium sp. HLX7-2 TaxID=1259331 RepID=UPI003F22D36E